MGQKLYVVNRDMNGDNSNVGDVEVFPISASGNATPMAIIRGNTTGLGCPDEITCAGQHAEFVAVDPANGNIYVSVTQNPPAGAVLKFAATANGNATPLATLADSTLTHLAEGLWVNSSQDLFIVSQTHLAEFGPDPSALTSGNKLKDISGPNSLLFDDFGMSISPLDGSLCVAGSQNLVIFPASANGSNVTANAIQGNGAPWASVLDCATDSSGNYYGSNFNNMNILKFASSAPKGPPNYSGNTAPTAVIATGANSRPYGMAFDNAGNLYVADYQNNAILKCTTTCTTLLSGNMTGLSKPVGIAVH